MLLVTLLWSSAGVVGRQLQQAQGFEVTFWRSAFTALALNAATAVAARAGAVHSAALRRLAALGLRRVLGAAVQRLHARLDDDERGQCAGHHVARALLTALFARSFLHQRLAARTWFAIRWPASASAGCLRSRRSWGRAGKACWWPCVCRSARPPTGVCCSPWPRSPGRTGLTCCPPCSWARPSAPSAAAARVAAARQRARPGLAQQPGALSAGRALPARRAPDARPAGPRGGAARADGDPARRALGLALCRRNSGPAALMGAALVLLAPRSTNCWPLACLRQLPDPP